MDDVGSNSQAPNTLGGGWVRSFYDGGFLGGAPGVLSWWMLKKNEKQTLPKLGPLVRGIFILNLERLYSSWS